ncbi:MAG TPA: hypothetical protein VL284_16590 [Thermoanaerobaculia bacterium]|nr:hypothetical protein [Thermoanaerobaculia bacterium]
MDSPEGPKHPLADVTPEQLRSLLASDFAGRTSNKRPPKRASRWRSIFWAAVILFGGIGYVAFRYTTTPCVVILVNASGEDARSIVLTSGTQRVDLGFVSNGDVRRAEIFPGNALRIESDFAEHHVWTQPEPLQTFQALTIRILPGGQVQVVRQTPWSQSPQKPATR